MDIRSFAVSQFRSVQALQRTGDGGYKTTVALKFPEGFYGFLPPHSTEIAVRREGRLQKTQGHPSSTQFDSCLAWDGFTCSVRCFRRELT